MTKLAKKLDCPRVGVGVIACNEYRQILLGKRKNAHGDGDWAPPGGHLEFGEEPIECALRELAEETGLLLLDPKELVFTNDIFRNNNKHYITVFVQGTAIGSPKVLEPHKCEQWEWFSLDSLPNPLFLPFSSFMQKMKTVNFISEKQ